MTDLNETHDPDATSWVAVGAVHPRGGSGVVGLVEVDHPGSFAFSKPRQHSS